MDFFFTNHHWQAASKTFFANKPILCDRTVPVKGQLRYVDAVVSPVAVFGSAHRTIHQKDLHQLDVGRKFLRACQIPSPAHHASRQLRRYRRMLQTVGRQISMSNHEESLVYVKTLWRAACSDWRINFVQIGDILYIGFASPILHIINMSKHFGSRCPPHDR